MAGIRFSIVITCYNQRDFIGAAIDSALAQGHPAKEIIVVDDGSSDGSVEVIEPYGDAIQLLKFSSNRGAIEARNRGVDRAQGEYIVFLDGDDIFMPWALEVYERVVAKRHPKIIFSWTRWFEGAPPPIDQALTPKIEFVEYKTFLVKDRAVGLSASAFVVDRQTFHDVGGWSPGIFHLDCQDLCTKLGVSGPMILICSPLMTLYRIHASNSIHNVAPFLRMAKRMMDKERAGEYPGGREHRFQRYAWFGGLWVFWTKRAMRAGLYTDGLKLAASGWLMILAAIARRSAAWTKGLRPIETIE
jgi:GT2 family glycosyltransferase